MPQPGSPASVVPRGEAELVRRIEDIERLQREQGLAALMAEIGPIIGKLRTQQTALAEAQAALETQQTALAEAQAALADVISKQVELGSIGHSEIPIAVTGSWAAAASGGITVPAGYTRCQVIAVGMAGAWNPTATPGYLNVRTLINGTAGATMTSPTDAIGYGQVTSSAVRYLTGLTPGTTITAAVEVKAAAWGSSASNIANIDAMAVFLR